MPLNPCTFYHNFGSMHCKNSWCSTFVLFFITFKWDFTQYGDICSSQLNPNSPGVEKPSNIMSKSTERLTKLSRLKFKVGVRGVVVMKHPVFARKFQLQVRDRPSYFQLTVAFSIRKCKNLSLQTCDWWSYKNVLFIMKRTPDWLRFMMNNNISVKTEHIMRF